MENKTLILVRHAKSSWKKPKLADHERSLNKRGKQDAPIMGQRLRKQVKGPLRIISSTAKRAIKTAKAFSISLGYEEDSIIQCEQVYEANRQKLINIIQNIHNQYGQIMLVGHNPGMAETVDYFSRSKITDMPTCAIAIFTFPVEDWKDAKASLANFDHYDYPKNITP